MKIFEDNDILVKFMIVNISSGIAIGMINLITPIFALSLHANSTEIGLIKGISGIGDLLIVLPAGVLVDHFGTRKLYPISCVLGGTTIVIFSLANSVNDLMLMMVAYGMSRTIRTTSLSASFFKHMKQIGVRKAGWYKGSMMIGSTFIGPTIAGILATTVSFTSFFVITSAFLVAPLIMVIANFLRRDSKSGTIRQNNASIKGSLLYYRELLRNKELVVATITDSVNTSFFMIFTTFITVLVVRDLGLSAVIAALLITIRGGSNMLVVFKCGELIRDDNHKLYLASVLGTILGLVLLGMTRNVPLLALASLITGVGSGLLSLITFTQVGNVNGEKGKIAGLNSLGISIGSICGPIIGGIIGDIFGMSAIFLSLLLPYVALTLYTLYLHKRALRVMGEGQRVTDC